MSILLKTLSPERVETDLSQFPHMRTLVLSGLSTATIGAAHSATSTGSTVLSVTKQFQLFLNFVTQEVWNCTCFTKFRLGGGINYNLSCEVCKGAQAFLKP